MAAETSSSAEDNITSTHRLFLQAKFEVPVAAGGNTDEQTDDIGGDGDKDGDVKAGSNLVEQSAQSVVITKQCFDASNCKTAVIGLPEGVEPTKVSLLH